MTREEVEKLIEFMPSAVAFCAGCEEKFVAKEGEWRRDQLFCSPRCADKSTAILLKPKPAGLNIDGWDV